MTLNVKGLRSNDIKTASVIRWILKQQVHVIFLQETHITKDNEVDFKRFWKGQVFHSFGSSNSRGVSILFHPNLDVSHVSFKADSDGRTLLINCKIFETYFTFINIYAPNKPSERNAYFRNMPSWILSNEIHNMIIAGDFNCILDKFKDKRGGNVNHLLNSISVFKSFCSNLKVVDAWRFKNPDAKEFTFRQKSPLVLSRLDYFHVQKQCVNSVNLCKIIPAIFSDHRAVLLSINIPGFSRGPGVWKLNVNLLKVEKYKDGIVDLIKDTKREFSDCPIDLVWELCKTRIRDFSIEFSKQRMKDKRERLPFLERKLEELDKKIDASLDSSVLNEYEKSKVRT